MAKELSHLCWKLQFLKFLHEIYVLLSLKEQEFEEKNQWYIAISIHGTFAIEGLIKG